MPGVRRHFYQSLPRGRWDLETATRRRLCAGTAAETRVAVQAAPDALMQTAVAQLQDGAPSPDRARRAAGERGARRSFPDAKLREDRVENRIVTRRADHFDDSRQRGAQIDSGILGRVAARECFGGAVARVERAAQAVAVPGIDRHRAFGAELLFAELAEDFIFQPGEAILNDARNAQRRDIVPVGVFRQVALVQEQQLAFEW